MKPISTGLVSAALIAVLSAPFAAAANKEATATIVGVDGSTIGEATLIDGPNGVLIHLKVTGIAPGKHGLHIHAVGKCEHGEGFKTAAGHVGANDAPHGYLNPEGYHSGDLPNIYVGADGVGELETLNAHVSLGGDGDDLLDGDGSTLVVHQNPDDQITQPIGGAGPRVACGIISG